MNGVKEYIFSVIAAVVLCGFVQAMIPQGPTRQLIKLLCGLIMAFTVISPISGIKNIDLSNFGLSYSREAQEAVASGEELSRDAMAKIIKQETEAYILDKAIALNADISVTITVMDTLEPVPESAEMSGTISPYARMQLESILESELGIPKEKQRWIG